MYISTDCGIWNVARTVYLILCFNDLKIILEIYMIWKNIRDLWIIFYFRFKTNLKPQSVVIVHTILVIQNFFMLSLNYIWLIL